MPAPVDLITIHHEGGGAPTDDARGAHGGYTYWLGLTYWTWLRPVWESFGTLNYNGESLDVCLSGNRMDYPVTDRDLELLAGICADARARGYVTATPLVRAHRDSPGSSTACPGDLTMARWPDVVAACTTGTVPPAKEDDDMPAPTDVVDVLVTDDGTWQLTADGGVFTLRGQFHGSYPGLPAAQRQGNRTFTAITERSDGRPGYTEWANDRSHYTFPTTD